MENLFTNDKHGVTLNEEIFISEQKGAAMPSSEEYAELYSVTEEGALNFWSSNLQDVMGDERWHQLQGSAGLYLASVLGHFCLESLDRELILSADYQPTLASFRQFADLAQIAEMMMKRMFITSSPIWMESAGAHILLHAGFFAQQNKARHNLNFYSQIGKDCYHMAAVGKRAKIMKLIARDFDRYLFDLARLQNHLWEKKYLL
jgi:hypothetical protein